MKRVQIFPVLTLIFVYETHKCPLLINSFNSNSSNVPTGISWLAFTPHIFVEAKVASSSVAWYVVVLTSRSEIERERREGKIVNIPIILCHFGENMLLFSYLFSFLDRWKPFFSDLGHLMTFQTIIFREIRTTFSLCYYYSSEQAALRILLFFVLRRSYVQSTNSFFKRLKRK